MRSKRRIRTADKLNKKKQIVVKEVNDTPKPRIHTLIKAHCVTFCYKIAIKSSYKTDLQIKRNQKEKRKCNETIMYKATIP